MFTFDRKPRSTAAHAPAPNPVLQRREKTLPVNPRWLQLALSSNAGTAAPHEMSEERRRYFEPLPTRDFSRISITPTAGAIQTKLAISEPRDEYEQEADRIAEHVMRMPEPQREGACDCDGACAELSTRMSCHEAPRLQTKRVTANESVSVVPKIVEQTLHSSGQPLDRETRTSMEGRFGHDFSRVRVHSDAKAAESARAMNALAYTLGRDIYFAAGQYRPSSAAGARLLSHELVHHLQQGGGRTPSALVVQRAPDDKAGKTSSDVEESPYEEELDVIRYALGAQEVGTLTKGTAFYHANDWEAVALSGTAFYVGPLFSDMGPLYYVYRFAGSDDQAGTYTFTRGSYLPGSDTKDLEASLAEVSGGKRVAFKTTAVIPPAAGAVTKSFKRSRTSAKPPKPAKPAKPTRTTEKRDAKKKKSAGDRSHGTTTSGATFAEQGCVADVTNLEQDMRDILTDWRAAAIDGANLFATAQLSKRIDDLESGSWDDFIMALIGNTVWAAAAFTPPGLAAFAVSMTGVAIAAVPTIPRKSKSAIPKIQKLMQDYIYSVYDELNKDLGDNARSLLDEEEAMSRYHALADFVQASFMPDFLKKIDQTYKTIPALDKVKIRDKYEQVATDDLDIYLNIGLVPPHEYHVNEIAWINYGGGKKLAMIEVDYYNGGYPPYEFKRWIPDESIALALDRWKAFPWSEGKVRTVETTDLENFKP